MMQNTHINFMGMYKKSYTAYAVVIALFIVSFFVRGLSMSIDFTGGRNYVVVLDKPVEVEQVREVLNNAFVNTVGDNAARQPLPMLLPLVQTVRPSACLRTTTSSPMTRWRTTTLRPSCTMH